jgi:Flp pilus assembly protein TadG
MTPSHHPSFLDKPLRPNRERLARGTERGIAALEFAIVFPMFFLILYGILTYGLIFVAQQSLTLAAEEGARSGLRYANDNLASNTCAVATSAAGWLGSRVQCSASAKFTCPYPGNTTTQCFKLSLIYPYRNNPLIPLLLGPLMNVTVPESLGSSATVQLD